jgi:hypothetical protein
VEARSKIVLREPHEVATPAPDSVVWSIWLFRIAAACAIGKNVPGKRRRELARGVALVGLAWLEACDEQHEDQPPA